MGINIFPIGYCLLALPKVVHGLPKGTPKESKAASREARGTQTTPKEAKGPRNVLRTFDRPPEHGLCYF